MGIWGGPQAEACGSDRINEAQTEPWVLAHGPAVSCQLSVVSGSLVPEAGFEPAHPFERHPLKMVCLPSSTTPAQNSIGLPPNPPRLQVPKGAGRRAARPPVAQRRAARL